MSGAPVDGPGLGAMLSEAVIMFHEAVASRRRLSAADHKALGIIERSGPLTASELAKRTGLTPGAITGVVDRLNAAGYVHRTHDVKDRRRVILTASGQYPQDVADAFAALRRSQVDFQQRYTDTEQAAIVDWITRISQELSQQTRRLGSDGNAATHSTWTDRSSHFSSSSAS